MDTARIRQLLDAKEKIDQEIRNLVNNENGNGGEKERRVVKCSTCDGEGHNSRGCKKKEE